MHIKNNPFKIACARLGSFTNHVPPLSLFRSLSLSRGLTGRTLANTSLQWARGKTVILGGRDGTKSSLRCVIWGKADFSFLSMIVWLLYNFIKKTKSMVPINDFLLKTKPNDGSLTFALLFFSLVVSTVFCCEYF